MSLFKRRQEEHIQDAVQKRDTEITLRRHSAKLREVRGILKSADETLAEEVQRLDRVLEGT